MLSCLSVLQGSEVSCTGPHGIGGRRASVCSFPTAVGSSPHSEPGICLIFFSVLQLSLLSAYSFFSLQSTSSSHPMSCGVSVSIPPSVSHTQLGFHPCAWLQSTHMQILTHFYPPQQTYEADTLIILILQVRKASHFASPRSHMQLSMGRAKVQGQAVWLQTPSSVSQLQLPPVGLECISICPSG